jgi:NAD(P)-dependent dehydrogenase (short-subunit alcohol dehydrogenase family)
MMTTSDTDKSKTTEHEQGAGPRGWIGVAAVTLGTFTLVTNEQGHGSIVNLSSTFGERGGPGAGLYVASKHAVNGLTRSAALEVATDGIRVNAVAPGPVATAGLDTFAGGADATATLAAGVPMGRLGHVDEIADIIQFLTSDKARFITGQIIAVNGGKTAR